MVKGPSIEHRQGWATGVSPSYQLFDKKPVVVFRRKNNLRNIFCKNDVKRKNAEALTSEEKCKGCKLSKGLTKKKSLPRKNGVSVKTSLGDHCKLSGVIYAINCKN